MACRGLFVALALAHVYIAVGGLGFASSPPHIPLGRGIASRGMLCEAGVTHKRTRPATRGRTSRGMIGRLRASLDQQEKSSTIVLDFDGVICDSAEATRIAYRAAMTKWPDVMKASTDIDAREAGVRSSWVGYKWHEYEEDCGEDIPRWLEEKLKQVTPFPSISHDHAHTPLPIHFLLRASFFCPHPNDPLSDIGDELTATQKEASHASCRTFSLALSSFSRLPTLIVCLTLLCPHDKNKLCNHMLAESGTSCLAPTGLPTRPPPPPSRTSSGPPRRERPRRPRPRRSAVRQRSYRWAEPQGHWKEAAHSRGDHRELGGDEGVTPPLSLPPLSLPPCIFFEVFSRLSFIMHPHVSIEDA